jgi:hypothetical protein
MRFLRATSGYEGNDYIETNLLGENLTFSKTQDMKSTCK